MGKSVIEINTAVRKSAAESAAIAAKIPQYTDKLEKIQKVYAADSNKVMLEIDAMMATANKAAADLRAKYEAEAKAIEAKATAQRGQLVKRYLDAGRLVLAQFAVPAMLLEIATTGLDCKTAGDECTEMLKELPKAPGDDKLRKDLQVLVAKTAKDYKSLFTQYSALNASAKKTVDACAAAAPPSMASFIRG